MRHAAAALLLLLVLARPAAAEEEVCSLETQWTGEAVRLDGAATSGDRVLVRRGERLEVFDRAGVHLGGRAMEQAPSRPRYLGTTGGFFELRVRSESFFAIEVRRLDLDGDQVGAPLVLQQSSPDVMNTPATAERDGLVAISWTRPRAQYSQTFDARLVVLRPDGSLLVDRRQLARPGAFHSTTAFAGDVVWMLWREDPDLRLVGVRYSLADGSPLDETPIEIASQYNAFTVAPFGDTLRLYALGLVGNVDVIDLAPDGTVTRRGSIAGEPAGRALPLPGGDILRVKFDLVDEESWQGTVTAVREDLAGNQTAILTLDGVSGFVPMVTDELRVVSIDNVDVGDTRTSTLVLRRLSLAGAPLGSAELDREVLVGEEVEVCSNVHTSSCSAGRGAGGGTLLLLALGLTLRPRRRAGQVQKGASGAGREPRARSASRGAMR